MGKPKPGKDGFPPGPKTLPLLGSLVDFRSNDAFLAKWSELSGKYGSVFSIMSEGRWVVFVTGWAAAREVLVRKGLDFCDKPRYPSDPFNPKRRGIFYPPCNDQWKCQRSFAHTTLRRFGLCKVSLEGAITQEVMDLVKKLQDQGGKPLYPRDVLGAHTANILFSVTFSERYSHDDPKFRRLLDCCRTVLVDYGKSPWSTGFGASAKASQGLEKFVTGQIQGHDESRVAVEDERDFVDAYLAQIDKGMAGFTYDELSYVLVDLICAGIESVSFTLLWTLLYMSRYPEVQDKVHQEIKTVIGERKIKLEDRNSLPYSQATLMEIQRAASLSFMVVRAAYTDSTIFDYKIPKGTEVWVNIWSVHHDLEVWKDPDTFSPERFLNEDGTELVRHEGFIPFSAGRRGCMGESLGKMELFIFFTSLMKHFRVETPLGETPPTTQGVLDFTRNPKPFQVRFVPR